MKLLLLALLAGLVLAAPAAGASVDVMVVGKREVLVPARAVTLEARTATVSGRRCALGRATALSALAGAGVPFRLRDYGSCSGRARDAGSLYVHRIGPDAARGRDGWVYKVGNRSGSAGAADPGGAFGTGRALRAGQRVLWFWCVKDRRDACQRTLATTAHAGAGGSVHVIVRGYDEQGRGVPVARRDGPPRRRDRDHRGRWDDDADRTGRAAPAGGLEGGARPGVPADGDGRLMRRALLLLALLGAAVCAAGCGLGAGESQDGGASLLVTRDFGNREIGSATADPIPGGETVMRMLQRDFDVETRYGGGFVQQIDGISGGRADGRPVDWFYYVNGILAEDGAAAHKVVPGDQIWWDHHDWGASQDIRAVVGAFPEPFASGVDGKRLPVRLDCAEDVADVCDEVGSRLSDEGINAGRSGAAGFGGEGVLRIKVGRWADLRRDSAVRRLEEGPRTSGVFARPTPSGDEIALLGPDGETVRTLGPGGGLVAATRLGGEAPTWILTGTDIAGVAAAAAQLRQTALAERFAIAVEAGRPVALPIQTPADAG